MTQEEKAKAYDEAKIRISKAYNDNRCTIGFMNEIFPELKESKESEDDRIRKGLISMCQTLGKEEWIAWLEKQGEQPIVDKAEPKFKVGDWVVQGHNILKIRCVGDEYYCYETVGGYVDDMLVSEIDSLYHLWTIQDARDGDVLACNNGWTCIFKTLVNDETFSSYCFMDKTKWFCETGCECHTLKEEFVKAYNGKIYPATKEQRDTLMKAMTDARYTFDFEKKELKKIEPIECSEDNLPEFESYLCLMFQKFRTKGVCTNGEIIDFVMEHSQKLKDTLCHAWSAEDYDMLYKATAVINKLCAGGKEFVWSINTLNDLFYWFKSLKDRVKPKSDWSEEDELNLSEALHHIRMYNLANKADKLDKWLKSLKTRVQPKQEWSDEDERQYRAAIAICNSLGHTDTANWLKSYRPQKQWKPSRRQMKDLAFVADQNKDNIVGKTMISLYKDLTKLTE